ncbi:MAG: hypothetical protein BWY73_01178 [candidate division TA06 bacterium ADurb.Bin417]|uniref:Uncharacterized protein n=1 Tax=candidate division TA06 bacterium ADurb.Bin417 TaxID=1852828 RepID=A0A1V5MD06_UNCT6|nr:MAG: hypothetical protein BWY73_01178 [candidate division TA06 bacterium ADurb.Bin417]
MLRRRVAPPPPGTPGEAETKVSFGDTVVNLGTLVFRLSEKIPVLDDNMLGGLDKQEAYRKGLAELLARREQETGRTGK